MARDRYTALLLSVSSFWADTTQRRFLPSCTSGVEEGADEADEEEDEAAEEAEWVLSVSSLSVSDREAGRFSDLRGLRFDSGLTSRPPSSLSVELPDKGDSGEWGDVEGDISIAAPLMLPSTAHEAVEAEGMSSCMTDDVEKVSSFGCGRLTCRISWVGDCTEDGSTSN